MKLTKSQLKEIIREEIIDQKLSFLDLPKKSKINESKIRERFISNALGDLGTFILGLLGILVTLPLSKAGILGSAITTSMFALASGSMMMLGFGDIGIYDIYTDIKYFFKNLKSGKPEAIENAKELSSKVKTKIKSHPELKKYIPVMSKFENDITRAIESGDKQLIGKKVRDLIAYTEKMKEEMNPENPDNGDS